VDRHVTEYVETRLFRNGGGFLDPAAKAKRGPIARLRAWQRKRQTIRGLEALDNRLLADIGLDRAAIWQVAEDLAGTGASKRLVANDNSVVAAA
jgi:uncharacterized protein YjiS (DUF1127 family)